MIHTGCKFLMLTNKQNRSIVACLNFIAKISSSNHKTLAIWENLRVIIQLHSLWLNKIISLHTINAHSSQTWPSIRGSMQSCACVIISIIQSFPIKRNWGATKNFIQWCERQKNYCQHTHDTRLQVEFVWCPSDSSWFSVGLRRLVKGKVSFIFMHSHR